MRATLRATRRHFERGSAARGRCGPERLGRFPAGFRSPKSHIFHNSEQFGIAGRAGWGCERPGGVPARSGGWDCVTLKVPSNPPVLRLAMAVSSATARPLLPTARLGGEEPGWGGPGVTVGVCVGGSPTLNCSPERCFCMLEFISGAEAKTTPKSPRAAPVLFPARGEGWAGRAVRWQWVQGANVAVLTPQQQQCPSQPGGSLS